MGKLYLKTNKLVLLTCLCFVLIASLMLFRLGHYPLWDDEANTAIFAHGIWETGDTTAVYGHNIWGYRDGVELNQDLKNRLIPPLSYYIVAPFLGLLGNQPFYLRLPFVLAGLLTLFMAFYWLYQVRASVKTHVLLWFGFLGSISFILYSRQCRYYTLTMLFSLLVAYFYLYKTRIHDRSYCWIGTLLLSLFSIMLLSTHYLAYAAVVSAFTLDFILWERNNNSFSRMQQAFIALTQIIAAIFIVSIWYPLGKNINETSDHEIIGKVKLFFFNIRDLNASEMMVGFVVILAYLIYFFQKKPNIPLLRMIIGYVVILLVVTVFSPQSGMLTDLGDVRYFAFALPFFIFFSVYTIENLPVKPIYHYVIAILIFFTTFSHAVFYYLVEGQALSMRSTFLYYLKELKSPPHIAYAEASEWIHRHVKPNETAFVVPGYAAYPLMYHAPELIYGWQFSEDKRYKFPNLPEIQFKNQMTPDYVMFFAIPGVRRKEYLQALQFYHHVKYVLVATINVSARARSRPEIYSHAFENRDHFDIDSEGVYIYRENLL